MRLGFLNLIIALNWLVLALALTFRTSLLPPRLLNKMDADTWQLVLLAAWVLTGYNLLRYMLARRRNSPPLEPKEAERNVEQQQ